MDAAVYSQQLKNNVTANLNWSVCSTFVVILQEKPVLHKQQFDVQLSYATVLHLLAFRGEVVLLYELRFMQ